MWRSGLYSIEKSLRLKAGKIKRHSISNCFIKVIDCQATLTEKVFLQGGYPVDIWVYIADNLSLIRKLSDHHHVEKIDLSGFLYELAYSKLA